MNREVYAVHYTAVIHGTAYYTIPEGEKLKHFVDGSADIEWNMSTIERVEAHGSECIDAYPDDDETEVMVTEFDPDSDIPF